MDALNRKPLLLGIALCLSGAAFAQSPNTGAPAGPNAPPAPVPKAVPYDCFGLEGVALRSCIDLNAAAANAGNNTPSTSHDCGGMTGAALATCRELNGEIVAPPMNSSNPGVYGGYGTPGYVAPGMAPGNVPPAGNTNPATGTGSGTGTGSSSGSNPTSLSPGSGTTGSSSGSHPTGLSGGSGRSTSDSAAPGTSTAGTGSNASSSGGGKSGM